MWILIQPSRWRLVIDDYDYAIILIKIAAAGMVILVPWIIYDVRKAAKALRRKKANRFKYRWKF
jgi:hypothetical protein